MEYEALRDIFTSTGGDDWVWKAGPGKQWDFSVYEDPCTEHWQGIVCNLSTTLNASHVSQLLLPGYGLVGHIPESLGNFSMMQRINLKNNSLSGTFPSSVGNLVSLQIINMNNNALSQSLPDSLGKLTKLAVLDFYINKLTGTIPQFLNQMPKLRYLDLFSNYLTGSIPTFLGRQYLHGSLPRSLGNLSNAIDFYVNENNLHGTIPSEYSNLQSMAYFDLTGNILSGGLADVFNPSVQKNLSMLLLSYNQLTGPLPDAIFLLPKLEVLDAGSNCLVNNPLSNAVCSSARLRTLALDGLHAAPACRKKVLSGITSTYILFTSLRGGVPDCIYSLPSLETLYMSSNGLTGSLPEKVAFGPNFTDLGISRNFLTGNIPHVFQTHRWNSLDLSYNKLGGTLSADFSAVSPSAYLSLRNNKLSGKIPDSIVNAPSAVSVIEGNWFGCKQDKSDLPKNDQYVAQYQCGSNSFNLAYYVWLSTFCLMLCSGMLLMARRKGHEVSFATTLGTLIPNAHRAIDVFQIKLNVPAFPGVTWSQGYLRESDCEDFKDPSSIKYYLRHYYRVTTLCKLLLRMCIVLTVYIVLVLLPLYGILSAYYGTLAYKYAYQLSPAFTSGVVALVLCMFFLMIVPVVAYVSFVFFFREHDAACNIFDREIDFDKQGEERIRINSTSSVDSSRTVVYIRQSKSLVFATLICTNAVVVIGANVGFVVMVQYLNQTAASMAQVALSIFKVGWGWICCNTTYHIDQELGQHQTNLKNGLFSALCVITVFNSIVVPCLVVMAISSTCFYNAFVPSESVESSYTYDECVYYEQTGCASYVTREAQTSIQPPFVYSYQCAGTILTYYAPSFVYVCFIQGLLIPFVRWTIPSLLILFPELTKFHWLMRWFVPKILNPVRGALPSTISPYFDARSFLVQMVNYLAVIMTFGVVFPPVAVCTVLTIISSGFFTYLEVKKFIKDAASKGAVKFIERIDRECMCMGTSAMLMHTIMMLVTISCVFYSIFLFDILGDQLHFKRSYWVVLVLIFEPLFLFCVYEMYIGSSFVRARLWVLAVLSGRSTKADHVVKVFHETPSPLVENVPCEVEMPTL